MYQGISQQQNVWQEPVLGPSQRSWKQTETAEWGRVWSRRAVVAAVELTTYSRLFDRLRLFHMLAIPQRAALA